MPDWIKLNDANMMAQKGIYRCLRPIFTRNKLISQTQLKAPLNEFKGCTSFHESASGQFQWDFQSCKMQVFFADAKSLKVSMTLDRKNLQTKVSRFDFRKVGHCTRSYTV